MQNLFFELIQVAMGNRKALSCVPTKEQWEWMLASMKKHAMLGIGFVAIQKLPQHQWPQKVIVMTFTRAAMTIGQKNAILDKQCREVCQELARDGFDAVVIKGQSNWECYPDELRQYRNPGDIDLWVAPKNKGKTPGDGVREIVEYALRRRSEGAHSKVLYYHIDYLTDNGLDVELHYRPSFMCSPLRNVRMQRWFWERFDACLDNVGGKGFPVLVPYVNVVYQLVHLYRHVFEGGVGLRQLMDYYYALLAWNGEGMSRDEVMRVVRSFGLGKFAAAVMWVMGEVFGNENDDENDDCWMICEPDDKEGRRLLEEILCGGNFGKYDMRDRDMKRGGMARHGLWKLKRMARLASSYTEEALWEPFFRFFHLLWRMRFKQQ